MGREKSDAPTFWIIAGPNGSGKSSLYGSNRDNIYGNTSILDFFRSFWIINPDLLASRIRSNEKLGQRTANLEAVKRIEAWLDASIKAHQSVGVETVLSTDKYRRLVKAAKKRGFEVRLVYVILQTPELNVDRVRLRVKKGGHPVPVGKIRERWTRSLRQLPWFLNQADAALIFDNSSDLRLVGRKEHGTTQFDPETPDVLKRALPGFPWRGPIKKKKR
ncbi:zeta toxin family protein [Bradyrhizobium sp.]|uniref:zeta toxin family protein n=1 Tax=Bradyrhizobium sp. TaxID=376 RepID=UPI002605094E|nr:zeta toxin family protein [Bradyrhizobium sp.]